MPSWALRSRSSIRSSPLQAASAKHSIRHAPYYVALTWPTGFERRSRSISLRPPPTPAPRLYSSNDGCVRRVQMSAKTIESLWFVEQIDEEEEEDDDEG